MKLVTFRRKNEFGIEKESMINLDAIVLVHKIEDYQGTTYKLELVNGQTITLSVEEFKPIGDSF